MIRTIQPKKALSAVATFGLWLVTATLGLLEIVIVRDLVLRLNAILTGSADALEPEYWTGRSFLGVATVFILAIVYIAIVIGGAEYHYRHFDQRSSWKLFGWTYAVMVAILVLGWFI